ncbi:MULTISPECIES: phosphoribosylformylglycinamidine synthase subunit PurS [Virgibacillus]|uniref:Phosphoribosylformylglycinamidine synthase subunit PurS n=1 Tax=Virgibacillus halodenitrificans TaxID=1482 RepID=A0AAC9IZU6_VIRHA|nr:MULTISPECIES: phosphoribosylformylglycinamidine synthase subunit PurS [Virgibacillus]AIF42449.1 phosphoribosylformylglycinamidine synthase [Virgibacillus sp. SK37]APC47165.1 phosphoribosylformylglycinamidine synthase subunit PurS [Virgibacillus halodenitrificans]MCG1027984.1 phosphoribosylformylglycinamidine synthase subunit PurS [Virgibacillus halodenitrificans]MCJ0931877.1 phosphoribosylformylglycinamidine synthase subunit PurS [Virgibacillus halodenitrificans]MEC2159410.1 phosphoribosylf
MRKVTVFITLKQGVLDPQGKAIQESLNSLGYKEIQEARVGKYIELQVEEGPELEARVKEMCDKLLANPVIEDYRFDVEEAVRS